MYDAAKFGGDDVITVIKPGELSQMVLKLGELGTIILNSRESCVS